MIYNIDNMIVAYLFERSISSTFHEAKTRPGNVKYPKPETWG
jgi:hypothetical protein